MIGLQSIYAITFNVRQFDRGSGVGFVEATLALAQEREDTTGEVCAMVRLQLAYLAGDQNRS